MPLKHCSKIVPVLLWPIVYPPLKVPIRYWLSKEGVFSSREIMLHYYPKMALMLSYTNYNSVTGKLTREMDRACLVSATLVPMAEHSSINATDGTLLADI
eukprot:GHVR01103605.1.p1 GENE.GHVR01103605.1~~GHVR01103605.1.p1  ORF type:complete len:100 (+),score=0.77 GHVR01103605.1:92-391(+)